MERIGPADDGARARIPMLQLAVATPNAAASAPLLGALGLIAIITMAAMTSGHLLAAVVIGLPLEVLTMRRLRNQLSSRLSVQVTSEALTVRSLGPGQSVTGVVSIPTAQLTQVYVIRRPSGSLAGGSRNTASNTEDASLWACRDRADDVCLVPAMGLRDAALWETRIEQHLELPHHPIPGSYDRLTEKDIPFGRHVTKTIRDSLVEAPTADWRGELIVPDTPGPDGPDR